MLWGRVCQLHHQGSSPSWCLIRSFILTLCRFTCIVYRGIPSTPWSDHDTNFVHVGAEWEIWELSRGESSNGIADFCNSQKIKWSFTLEHAPHFGGLWEAVVNSKVHVRKTLGEVTVSLCH